MTTSSPGKNKDPWTAYFKLTVSLTFDTIHVIEVTKTRGDQGRQKKITSSLRDRFLWGVSLKFDKADLYFPMLVLDSASCGAIALSEVASGV